MIAIATLKSRFARLSWCSIAFALLATQAILPIRADPVSDGKTAFAICSACHSVTGANGLGPHLNGVIGRKAGSVVGFNYSPAMKRANIVWDAQTLDKYSADPQQVVPGNRMPFPGLPDATKRADIVAYLATIK
jgi:cytochrome c